MFNGAGQNLKKIRKIFTQSLMVGLQLDFGCNYGEGVVRVRVNALTVRVSALRVRIRLGLRCT